MAEYVKFSVPEDLKTKQKELLGKIKKTGKVKIGANEATKAAERGTAKLIILAEDVSPPEIVMHLPLICKEKNIPIRFAGTKKALGETVGLSVGTAALAITDEGDTKKDFDDLVKKIQQIAK